MTVMLQSFTIRTRMLGAIAMVLFLFAALGATGLYGLGTVQSQADAFVAGAYADQSTLTQLDLAVGNARRYEKDLLINASNAAQRTAYAPQWRAAVDQATTLAHRLGEPGRADPAAAARIEQLLKDYAERAAPVMRQIQAGEITDITHGNESLAAAKAAIHDAETQLAQLSAALARHVADSEAARHATSAQASWLFGMCLLVATVVVVPLTLLNMVSICRPIARAQALAEQIATGDLSGPVQVDGRDESARLMSALGSMQDSLRRLVGQVRSSTDSIGTASAEIATGNQDLSNRTEQTASNLQHAASSMEQLTGAVKQSADSARHANQLANSAAEVAARGGAVVSQVVATMDDINTSSKKIADIIGVIDSIAFQTNILALNAAVEAARAGEQGRGFAVVASEVRSLAQRSAEAAREIKSLIGASVDKVEGGSRLVADAGRTMNEIVGSVQRVSDIIGEITAAAAEQSDGIGQVNGSVSQLDQMTQQNAALVEQSAAAAESLKEQASALARVVGAFRLEASATRG